jgi:hypothetical protein
MSKELREEIIALLEALINAIPTSGVYIQANLEVALRKLRSE